MKDFMTLSICLYVSAIVLSTFCVVPQCCVICSTVCDIAVFLTETVKKTHEVVQPPRYVEHSYRLLVIIYVEHSYRRVVIIIFWVHCTPYHGPVSPIPGHCKGQLQEDVCQHTQGFFVIWTGADLSTIKLYLLLNLKGKFLEPAGGSPPNFARV